MNQALGFTTKHAKYITQRRRRNKIKLETDCPELVWTTHVYHHTLNQHKTTLVTSWVRTIRLMDA